MSYRLEVKGPAQRFFLGLPPELQLAVGRLLEDLVRDPDVDGFEKTRIVIPPIVLSCYLDQNFWILYQVVEDRLVSVVNINYADESRSPW